MQENIHKVYNWQFIHALRLWTNVIGTLYQNDEKFIQQLVHPLTELIIGTIRYHFRFGHILVRQDVSHLNVHEQYDGQGKHGSLTLVHWVFYSLNLGDHLLHDSK